MEENPFVINFPFDDHIVLQLMCLRSLCLVVRTSLYLLNFFFIYMLGSFVMMIDVLVWSLHRIVSFCRLGFFGVAVCSCGSTVVLLSVWLCGWTSGSYNTWLLAFCMFHTVAFFQKGLFLLWRTLLLVLCHKIQMIGSGYRFTD